MSLPYYRQKGRGCAPVAFRLLSRVKSFDEDCWEWIGSLTHGYGQLTVRGHSAKAHQISYLLHKGEIPAGMCVMHTCDNRKCINPAHLVLGTNRENFEDMRRKSRHVKGSMFPQAKLCESDVPVIRKSPESNRTLASRFGVNPSVISRIRTGKVWRHVH